MRRTLIAGLLVGLAAGCGDGVPKPKELTAEDLKKMKEDEKRIEDEERGPARAKGKGKKN